MNHPMIHLCRLLGSILLESILRYFIRAETWGFGLSIKKLGQVRESILLESRLGSFSCLSKSGSPSSVLQIILKSHSNSIFAKSASMLPYMELVSPYMVREHENRSLWPKALHRWKSVPWLPYMDRELPYMVATTRQWFPGE